MTDAAHVRALPSATIAVVRDADDGPELLLVRRRAGDAFGDSYTFPGGVVDADENAAHVYCAGIDPARAAELLGVEDSALDYYSAAIRELFEETGILLAKDDTGGWPTQGFSGPRRDVDRGTLPWTDFLEREGLCLAADSLHYFAWWVTPRSQPKRWTTRFFLARLPSGQHATIDGTEVTDLTWLSPAAAIARAESRELPMPFPTRRNIERMTACRSGDELTAWADRQQRRGIDRVCPSIIERGGRQVPVIPGDPGYPAAGDS